MFYVIKTFYIKYLIMRILKINIFQYSFMFIHRHLVFLFNLDILDLQLVCQHHNNTQSSRHYVKTT